MTQSNIFDQNELVKVSVPPNLYRVEEGQFVQLVSGGLKMIVSSFDGVAPTGTAIVHWDSNNTRMEEKFYIVCLTAWPAADIYRQ